ncbi:MAG TPA: hypothetical protein VLH39_07640, partial [Magnetospirillaceae bacterium]|nr:hypothetical protein [Magnetospirillaceae bacterium]
LFEVQRFYMRTDYIRDIETFYVNPGMYAGLSAADQRILFEASEEAGALVTRLTRERIDTAFATLRPHMTVVTEPELRLDLIRRELEGLFNDWEGVRWPAGLLVRIANM